MIKDHITRRHLFVWENAILEDLFGVLEERGPSEGEDVWWWNAEERGEVGIFFDF